MTEEIDRGVIKRLVGHKLIDFGDLRWINCVLHNAGMKDFATREEYDNAVIGDDEFLLIFLLIYSFERMGFDSKLSECTCRCEWYQHDYKIKSHPVSVLLALSEIKRERRAGDLNTLLVGEEIENLASEWLERSMEAHTSALKRGFNQRGFNINHLMGFLRFFHGGRIAQLRDRISKSSFHDAYNLLVAELVGIGPKVARFIVRDLAFSLTDWGKKLELDRSTLEDPKALAYAIPVDRWVRRVSIAIPTIGNRLKESLAISDLADDSLSDRIDEKLSLTIAEVCHAMNLNPMRFDLGAYLFGVNTIKRKAKVEEIYRKLQQSE